MDHLSDIFNLILVDLKESTIDKENNIIRNVAILSDKAIDTSGKIFRIFTDKALNDAINVLEGALARMDHDRQNESLVEPRGVNNAYGVYQSIKRKDNKIFGDVHLWDCEAARKVMSIAERTPNAVGNSIHVGGIVTEKDGVEVVEQIVPRTKHGFKPSIDLVEDPAAVTGLFQNKKSSTNNNKENNMEWKDLTLDGIKTNRPELYETIKAEGFASRNAEIKSIEQERDDVSKKCDQLEVKLLSNERAVLVGKLLTESTLPDYAKTEAFRKQLLDVKESKDGDKVISAEDAIRALIQDRVDAITPGGVTNNPEKDIHQTKGSSKVEDADFITAFKSDYGTD